MKTNVMFFHTSDHDVPKILTQADDAETAARYMREIAIRPAGALIVEAADVIDVYCVGYGFSYFLEAAEPEAQAEPQPAPAADALTTPEQERKIATLIAAGTPHRRAIRIVVTNNHGTGLLTPALMRYLGKVIAQYEKAHNLAPAA